MPLTRKRPTGSDEQLEREIGELGRERAEFARAHVHLRESAHEGVEQLLVAARVRLDNLVALSRLSLDGHPSSVDVGERIGSLVALTSPEGAECLHALIDSVSPVPGQPGFSELTRKQVQEKLASLDQEVAVREEELARREIERRKAEVDAELAALGEGVKV